MDDLRQSLHRAADLIADYREGLPASRVTPSASRQQLRETLSSRLPDRGDPADVVLKHLSEAQPGLMATDGPRYFGFVVGGSLDAALLADLITTGWDQNAFNEALSPAALAFEDMAGNCFGRVRHRSPGCQHRRIDCGEMARPHGQGLGRRC
jgi:glutamate/tyrosine decarboxylase-like PLP-dependent enzyme